VDRRVDVLSSLHLSLLTVSEIMRKYVILNRGKRTFPIASVPRPALGPIQLPIQWVEGVLFQG
jgi:hypothetical protein